MPDTSFRHPKNYLLAKGCRCRRGSYWTMVARGVILCVGAESNFDQLGEKSTLFLVNTQTGGRGAPYWWGLTRQ